MTTDKTPGAMVLMPRILAEKMLDGSASMGWSMAEDLRAVLATPAEQTPAVGGELPAKRDVLMGGQYNARDSGFNEGVDACRPIVAMLLTEIERERDLRKSAETCEKAAWTEHAELKARIAELEAQQGEPVVWECNGHYYEYESEANDHSSYHSKHKDVFPLYRAQPATAKVVLPHRKSEHYSEEDCDIDYPDQAKAWNACLDEVARLNLDQES